jgi:hypothetical protein
MVEVFAFGGGFFREYFDFGLNIFVSRKDTKEQRRKVREVL